MKYIVVKGDLNTGYHPIDARVQKKIDEGWKPLGGVSVTDNGYCINFYQAMIKDSDDNCGE